MGGFGAGLSDSYFERMENERYESLNNYSSNNDEFKHDKKSIIPKELVFLETKDKQFFDETKDIVAEPNNIYYGNKKYYMLKNDTISVDGHKLYRIVYKINISYSDEKGNELFLCRIGDFGGYIEKPDNLSELGNAWISASSIVYDNAKVYGNARIMNGVSISDSAQIFDDARVSGANYSKRHFLVVCGNVKVYGKTLVQTTYSNGYKTPYISGDIDICGSAEIKGYCVLNGNGVIYG